MKSSEYPKRRFFSGSTRAFWLELTPEDQSSLLNLSFLSLWHLFPIGLALLLPQHLLLACAFTWSSNLADLLVCIVAPRRNLNNAKRLDMTVLHHLFSLTVIPLVLALCPPEVVRGLQLQLETSGLISLLGNLLFLTPAPNSHWFALFFASCWGSIALLRGPVWTSQTATVLDSFLRQSADLPLRAAQLAAASLFLAATRFNWFMIEAWERRVALFEKELSGSTTHWAEVVTTFLRIAWTTPTKLLLYFGIPAFSAHLRPPVLLAVALLVLTAPLVQWALTPRKSRRTRKEFHRYEDCRWVLNSPDFSPLPYRYVNPHPVMKPFADWMKVT